MNWNVFRWVCCHILCYCSFLLIHITGKLRRNILKCLQLFKNIIKSFFSRHDTVLLVSTEDYWQDVKITCTVIMYAKIPHQVLFLGNFVVEGKAQKQGQKIRVQNMDKVGEPFKVENSYMHPDVMNRMGKISEVSQYSREIIMPSSYKISISN